MHRSTDRILVTHAGGLTLDMHRPRGAGDAAQVRRDITEAVVRQARCGVDVINDGEQAKTTWNGYARERLGGLELRTYPRGEGPAGLSNMYARDIADFGEYFELNLGARGAERLRVGQPRSAPATREVACVTAPLTYIGQAAVRQDIANFKTALAGVEHVDAFLTAIAPGTIEHWLQNEYYSNQEDFLFAIADAMHAEYQAITDAGIILQLDDPDLPDAWQIHPELSVPRYQEYQELRVEAINRALRGIPPEMVRLHVCWGSGHGPHTHDIPLKEIIGLIYKVNAEAYSIEAANARHEHEWTVFRDAPLPDGKILIPGVAGHATDHVEHPELIAQRLLRYAVLVGRENVIAGTDCGLGHRVGHPDIAWAKLAAMAEGARLASRELWGR